MAEYLTGEELVELLLRLECDDCGHRFTDEEAPFTREPAPSGGWVWIIHCPKCGNTETFTPVTTGQ
jgi:ribosomal protein S27E